MSHIIKNMFSLVSTYINWSSLSLPTPRMRKTNDSCMISAAHPLVTWRSYTLFRFSSFRFFHRLASSEWWGAHPRGEVQCVQREASSVSQCHHSELDTQITLSLVVKINISAYILSQLQKNGRDSSCVSFLMTTCQLQFVLACLCALTTSHRTTSVTRVSPKLALAPTTAPKPQVRVIAETFLMNDVILDNKLDCLLLTEKWLGADAPAVLTEASPPNFIFYFLLEMVEEGVGWHPLHMTP